MTRILPIVEFCQNVVKMIARKAAKDLIHDMNIKSIRTEKDYRAAMKRIDELISINPAEGTAQFDELDMISTMVESYESIHYPIEARIENSK